MDSWKPITEAAMAEIKPREMFVVKAIDVSIMMHRYTSDAYCVWIENGKFARWPHWYEPTHYIMLPSTID